MVLTTHAFLAAFFVCVFLFVPSIALADTHVLAPSTISGTTTWTVSSSPYIVEGHARISVTGVLTIEPGVVIKFSAGEINGLEARNGGRIIAHGTSDQPIVFTSYHDDTVGGDSDRGAPRLPRAGDWQGISLVDDASDFSHVIIRYGGAAAFAGNFGGLDIRGNSQARISDTTIESNFNYGLALFDPAAPTLERLTIQNNSYAGIYSTLASHPVTIVDSAIMNNPNALQMTPDNSLWFDQTTFTGNTLQTVQLMNVTSHITHAARWQYILGLTYVDSNHGRLFVDPGASLTIDPGVQVKWYPTLGLYVQGELQANGTETQPIVFTSYRDDTMGGDTNGAVGLPQAGDWGGIYFDHATGALSYLRMQYGGSFAEPSFGGAIWSDRNVVHVAASHVSMGFVTISDGYNTAVTIDGASDVSFNSSTIHQVPNGIEVNAPLPFVFRNNYFSSTTNFALRNDTLVQVDARHNWWGDDSGPRVAGRGDRIVGANGLDTTSTIQYDPWIGKRDPVILIPGILGSEMWKGDELLWADLDRMAASPGDAFMDSLAMNEDGSPSDSLVFSSDTLRDVKLGPISFFHYFDRLISEFSTQGYREGADLFVFPYDWRLDIKTNSARLATFIADHATSTGKVDIVAHSMGGLVTKQYIIEHPDDPKIDTVVFVGTPNLGAPKTVKTLLFGDDFDTFGFLNPAEIKKIGRNMLSVYQLLPSPTYFDIVGDYFIDLASHSIPDFFGTKIFLKNQGLNSHQLDQAEAFHTNALDNFVPPVGIQVYNIAGCDEPTIGTIIRRNLTDTDEEYFIGFVPGDKTVPLASADAINIPGTHRYYVHGAKHSDMPSEDGVRQLLAGIISRHIDSTTIGTMVTQNKDECHMPSARIVSVHSPVDLHIYDTAGNHVGPNADGGVDQQIPGVAYENIANNKFVFLPDGVRYDVHLDATATGTFSLRVSDVVNDGVVTTTYYKSIPIVPESQGIVTLGGEPTLGIDEHGTGESISIAPSAILSTVEAADFIKPETQIHLASPDGIELPQDRWVLEPVTVSLVATDDSAGVLRTEYSLDGGNTWQIYLLPFVVNSENIHVLYRSIDRAGNIEEIKSQQIFIDNTPPEARITFDPNTRSIKVTGFDSMSSSTVVQTTSSTIISDAAGNTLRMQVAIINTSTSPINYSSMLQITAVRYNEGAWQSPDKNGVVVYWQLDKKTNDLLYLNEILAWKDHFYLASLYGPHTGGTQIWSKDATGSRTQLVTLPNLVIPEIQFSNFVFNYSY